MKFGFFNQEISENEILNKGLEFAMEFGSNWLQSIHTRLSKKYKQLSKEKLDYYNDFCRMTMDEGHRFINESLCKLHDDNKSITQQKLKEDFNSFMLGKYNWINNQNLKHLFSQSLYYTWKEGLNDIIK